MSIIRLKYLFDCYVNNKCSNQEKDELMSLMSKPEYDEALQNLIDDCIDNPGFEIQLPAEATVKIITNIIAAKSDFVIPKRNNKRKFPMWRSVAASVLVLVGMGYLFFGRSDNKEVTREKVAIAADKPSPIFPGRNQAVLTSSDGDTIFLDSAENGVLKHQGIPNVKKNGFVLVYDRHNTSNSGAAVSYNTLYTPRGGSQYQVVLSDGTRVWLNAASSIRFPTVFAGQQREIELTGEAYFEVAKNKEKPFQVKVGDSKIKVLGTHFNVNAYSDEPGVKTTLLEGSVAITNGQATGLLKPGEQAVTKTKENKVEIGRVNMAEVMAWKNGLFQFSGADITTIMRAIERWYDVQVVYAGKTSTRHFEGKLNMNAELSEVLKILELCNVKFTVEGKRIIVE